MGSGWRQRFRNLLKIECLTNPSNGSEGKSSVFGSGIENRSVHMLEVDRFNKNAQKFEIIARFQKMKEMEENCTRISKIAQICPVSKHQWIL